MSWGYHEWRPYVPVAERRARAAREMSKLAKKNGVSASPVVLDGRKIASTFWGKAWCDNLEAYSDFANRLPRGRTYVRNGSVVDLQISAGKVTARVSGSALYKIDINIKPLPPKVWKSIQCECAGKIDSLIELLQGKLSSAVMQVVTRPNGGLFPAPREIDLDCSCPDWADLCKHVAASLYGVGARLDSRPELLFVLRGVDPADLISTASAAQAVRPVDGNPNANGAPAMSDAEMADVFGIELEAGHVASVSPDPTPSSVTTPPAPTAAAATRAPVTPERKSLRRAKTPHRLDAKARARIVAALKKRWRRAKMMGLQGQVPLRVPTKAQSNGKRRSPPASSKRRAEDQASTSW